MISERDVLEAIAECQGERKPNVNTCIKLAAFYTILDHLRERETAKDPVQDTVLPTKGYSTSSGEIAHCTSGSDFSIAVNGRPTDTVMAVMDELMETLQVINPRLYDAVLAKLAT